MSAPRWLPRADLATRQLRLGMVGGGQGAFIGAVHRIAARLDDDWTLVAGALSADADRAVASGTALGLAPERCYADYRAMAQAEAARPDGIDAVAIVTPNHLHVPVASAFIEAGIAVICDKPIATSLADAQALHALAEARGVPLALTHNYSGYPVIRAARAMVAAGEVGALRIVQVEYAQDWLAEPLEASGQKQAAWRTDPAQAGPAGCLGDIGTHAAQLAEFVTGERPAQLSAELTTFVPGRRVDDHVQVQLRYASGARGLLWASQVAAGEANHLRLRVYGSRAALHWDQETPEQLWLNRLGEGSTCLRRGGPGWPTSAAGLAGVTRTPAGHPEGYLEAFGQLYRDFAADLRDRAACAHAAEPLPDLPAPRVPGTADGVRSLAFVETVLSSAERDSAWTDLPPEPPTEPTSGTA
jgi:predicted dehydrogenase